MERKQIILDIPSGYKPELTEQEDSYLLRFFESKEELEDILRVPESIGIYQTNSCNHGDGLFINFNKKQFLGVNARSYVVDAPLMPLVNYSRIQCELIPCEREDLKAGDTAFMDIKENPSNMNVNELDNYCKIISNKLYVRIAYDTDTEVYNDNLKYSWYKVVPIKE